MDSRLKRAAFRGALIGIGLAAAIASAATFNLFQPASGLLVGNPSTYVTTAATSSNVIPLWSGTCNTSTFLRGDGQCAAPPGGGGGTVSSVGLTMPSGFSVGGSPVTGSSVLAVTTTLSGVIKGTGSGFTAAAAADVVALFSTCSGTQFLGADGACHTAGTVASVALADSSTSPIFTITGSPVTGSGTLTETLSTQSANTVFAGPTTGSAAQPAFRALVSADIPPINLASTANGGITGNLPFAHLTITSGNVIGLWTGTCSSSTFLRGDGACVSPGGGGTVTSVDVAGPAGFTSSGGPITSSGTITLSYAGGQTANSFLATPNGTMGALGLRTIVAGDLPGSLTSNTSGNAATATALAATPSQCSGGNFATGIAASGNANCTALAYPVGANPSGSIGLSAVNGSATTFLRSDGHPALDQSISPTWTGTHLFSTSPVLANAITLNAKDSSGASGALLQLFSDNNVYLDNSSSGGINFRTATGTIRLGIAAGGAITINAPTTGIPLTINGESGVNDVNVVGPSGAQAGIELTDGQSGAATVVLHEGFCSGGAPGVFDIYNKGFSTLCINAGIYTPGATGGDKGLGTLNAQGLYVNGLPVLTSASGAFTVKSGVVTTAASSCTVNQNNGIGSSCTYNGVGNFTIAFTAAFSTNAACVVTPVNGFASTGGTAYSQGSPTTSVSNITMRNLAGTPADGSVSIVCVGS